MSVLFLPPSAGASAVPDASETVSGKIRIATSAEATTGTNDLTAMTPLKVKTVVDAAVVGGVTYKGTFDTSSPVDLSNALKGDMYVISVAGTYQGIVWAVGDHLLINEDMGGTISPSKLDKVDNTDAVTSVAGKTGAVTLVPSDITGLATVASTGAYSDLSGTPTLGTAAAEDVGTAAGNVVQLDGSARLPAVDGSQLTNLPSATVAALDDIGDVTITSVSDGEALVYDSGQWVNGSAANTVVQSFSTTPASSVRIETQDLHEITMTGSGGFTVTVFSTSDGEGAPVLFINNSSAACTLATTSSLVHFVSNGSISGSNTTTIESGERRLFYVQSTTRYMETTATYLDRLADVSLSSPSAGEALVYNGTLSAFQNATITASVAALNDVGDVNTTGVANTNVIKYNSISGDWEAGAVAASEVSGLGTAAALDVGTSASNVVQLDGSARLPAVDGSQLTNLPSAPVTSVAGKTGVVTLSTDDLTDMDTTTAAPVAEDRFKYDGSNWVPVDPFEVVATVTTTTSLTVPEQEQLVRTSGSGITLNLPNIASNSIPAGVRYQLKVTDSNTITVAPNGTELLEGSNSSYSTSGAKEALTVICDGSGWWFV